MRRSAMALFAVLIVTLSAGCAAGVGGTPRIGVGPEGTSSTGQTPSDRPPAQSNPADAIQSPELGTANTAVGTDAGSVGAPAANPTLPITPAAGSPAAPAGTAPPPVAVSALPSAGGLPVTDPGDTPAHQATAGAPAGATGSPTVAPTTATSRAQDQPATVDGHDPPWNQAGIAQFHSPSGNISCIMGEIANDGSASVECEIAHHAYATPAAPSSCTLDYGDRFVLRSSGPAVLGCHGDTLANPSAAALPYGISINYGSLACTSSESGMWCGSLDTGHYFKVASADYELG